MIGFNALIRAMGGRKYFYSTWWGLVATSLLWAGKIDGLLWAGIIAYTFSNVVIANNREAVATIKQGNPAPPTPEQSQ